MSNRIQKLNEDTIRLIAAGEVVERPSSVVKELLENSIDAGSTEITLEITEGGKAQIRVSDDGCGMSPEDALLSLERHSTSKIRSATDLETLSTMGFRGEAIPSIAQVSKLKMVTCTQEGPSGTALTVEGGKLNSNQECARSQGTTIEINELFYNTPARLKFLKAEITEKNKILKIFEEIAIAHPEISFKAVSNKRTLQELPIRTEPLRRISDLWGDDFNSQNMIPISFEHPLVTIQGWISEPQFHHSTKNFQTLYVNKRPIQSKSLNYALYESYRDALSVGRHPAAIIQITLDSSQVDVNAHPSKREVRFRNERQIMDVLMKEIRSKRSKLSPPANVLPQSSYSIDSHKPLQPFSFSENHNASYTFNSPPPTTYRPEQKETTATLLEEKPRVLTQFSSLYVIAENKNNLMIIDQHAAGERILYEKFKEALLNEKPIPTQTLLIPMIWNVSISQMELIRHHKDSFKKLGFSIEEFGERSVRMSEAPSSIPETELKTMLDEILASLENQSTPSLAVEEKIMHSACRAAIKANDHLTMKEHTELLEQLSKCSNPHTCPHGRPITLTITRAELDKKFGRT